MSNHYVCCTLETNIMLKVNCNQKIKIKQKQLLVLSYLSVKQRSCPNFAYSSDFSFLNKAFTN